MDEVYIVTAGEYSDYHIVAVFIDAVEAEKFCNLYNEREKYSEAQVETWEIAKSAKELDGWFVRISREDGSEIESYPEIDFNKKDIDVKGNIYAWANTKEKALKIARDYRAKILAEEKGL